MEPDPKNGEGRKHSVGRYFVGLTEWMLCGGNADLKVLLSNDPDGDLIHWGLNASLEVKGSDNNHHFLVYEEQLERHLRDAEGGFPVEHCFYVLFAYKNRGPRPKRRCLLQQRGTSEKRIVRYLANNTTTAYVVDARILKAARKRFGTSADVSPSPD